MKKSTAQLLLAGVNVTLSNNEICGEGMGDLQINKNSL